MANLICGVDISSTSLETSLGPGQGTLSFANTAGGIAALARFCQQQGITLVAMEASGGYEKLAFALWKPLLWQRKTAAAAVVGKLETPTCLRLVSIASAFPTFPQPNSSLTLQTVAAI